MILFISSIILLCLLWLYFWIKPFLDAQKNLKRPNQLKFMWKSFWSKYTDVYDKVMGPIVREKYDILWMAHCFTAILHNPADVQIALNSEKCFEKSIHMKLCFKYGWAAIGGDKIKQQRKALLPMFTTTNLRSLIPIINLKANEFFNDFSDDLIRQGADIKLLTSKFSYNVICDAIYKSEQLDKENLHDSIVYTAKTSDLVAERFFKPWYYPDNIFKFTKDFAKIQEYCQSITSIIEHRKLNAENFITYSSCMKDLNSEMSRQEYLESMATFFGASFDTTSATIADAILLLSMNPEKQQKLYDEVSSILKSVDDKVTEEKLNQMSYLNVVVKETLRLFPASVFTSRKTSDDVKFTNYTMPKGTTLLIPTFELHRDKTIWGEDSLKFRPERFQEENFKNIHPYAYIPFSNGPRICPGYKYSLLTIKIFLSKFVMNYHISSSIKFEDIKYVIGLTLKLQVYDQIVLKKRQDCL